MTTTNATAPTTTRVSIRDLSEATFRALTAHGASHGEARAGARMILQAEFVGGAGLAALGAELTSQPWSPNPVEIVASGGNSGVSTTVVSLRTDGGNRLLREGHLAIELVTSTGPESIAIVECEVTGGSVLDAVLLEAARVTGTAVGIVIWANTEPGTSDEAACSDPVGLDHLRVARPDGSLGVGGTTHLPGGWVPPTQGTGIAALRDVDQLGDVDLAWTSADDFAKARATAAAVGITVNTRAWRQVYGASRRYLVPD